MLTQNAGVSQVIACHLKLQFFLFSETKQGIKNENENCFVEQSKFSKLEKII